MRVRFGVQAVLGSVVAVAMYLAGGATAGAQGPLAIDSARITISGTSNIHAYTATTTTVRVTRAQVNGALADALKPGSVEAFEIAIPAATLTSPREGLDKNMHKALQVKEYPDITFRLLRLEPRGGAPGFRAGGLLKIAGVEKEVAFDVTADCNDSTIRVQGQLLLLMTDFGIKPPVAMLGMLKTDPKVTIAFETVLSLPHP